MFQLVLDGLEEEVQVEEGLGLLVHELFLDDVHEEDGLLLFLVVVQVDVGRLLLLNVFLEELLLEEVHVEGLFHEVCWLDLALFLVDQVAAMHFR